MTDFDVAGIHCYETAAGYACVPAAPRPELAPNGRPTLALWVIPPRPRLQLGTRWELTPEDLDSVRAAVVARHPATDPNISSAPVEVDEVALLIGDGAHAPAQLATSSSSGFPPFAAVFSIELDDAQAALVTSALNGARGRLTVEYRARFTRSTPIRVAIDGDVSDDLSANAESAPAQIDRAVQAGHLTVTRTPANGLPEDVFQPLEQQARALAAEDLARLAAGAGGSPQAAIHEQVSGTHDETTAVVRDADVADWFAGTSGADSVHVLPITQPTK